MGTAWWDGGPYSGCTGDCVALREMLSWRVHGGAEDCVLGIGGYTWQYWGPYGGSARDARRYWGAVQ